MAAIDYLKLHHLNAEVEGGDKLVVWPKSNITPEMREWIKAHRDELLEELTAANDPESPIPESGIDLLLKNLRFDFTGAPLHDIDEELEQSIRQAMLPIGKRDRAELAARLDDLLVEPDGRRQAMALLHGHTGIQQRIEWIDWLRCRCPLVREDVAFLRMRFERRSYGGQAQMAWRYVDAWRAAVLSEPHELRKENAGRRAANQTLPPLQTHESLRLEGARLGSLDSRTVPHPGWYNQN